jgi:lipopolysaccharide export LptBFGC system permease protein LptF
MQTRFLNFSTIAVLCFISPQALASAQNQSTPSTATPSESRNQLNELSQKTIEDELWRKIIFPLALPSLILGGLFLWVKIALWQISKKPKN